MPLVTIKSLPPVDPTAIARLLTDVRDVGAAALRCATSNIWVMFEALPPGSYLQGDAPATTLQATTHPPVVIVRAQAGRSTAERDAFAAAVAAAVGRALGVPAENVWLHYQEMRPQDVWFNGRWSG